MFTSQPCTLVAKKADSLLGFIKLNFAGTLREVILLLYLVLLRHAWSTGFNSGFSITREKWNYWGESSEGLQR